MKVILRPNWSLAMMGEVAMARNKARLGKGGQLEKLAKGKVQTNRHVKGRGICGESS